MFRKDLFITGEYYHIYNRGIDKRIIFKLKRDYERFMILLYLANSNDSFRLDDILNKQHKTFSEILVLDKGESLVSIGAWCLMSNHFHLLVRQEVDGGITKFMRKLGVGYSMFFNIKYQRTGSLFGGLFKSKLIGVDDNYMRQLFGYIHINPVEIEFPEWKNKINKSSVNMKKFLESYRYSSYLDYVDEDRIEKNIIARENFPDYFHDTQSFKDFIENYFSNSQASSQERFLRTLANLSCRNESTTGDRFLF
ncbi:MAG: Transposase [Candidatus Nomurabacteria bacterium GW2011_GWA1_37_20]|uniref:Transposase n=2 Tax=Parcubacteria group TaxID=1794811 RepID=A0A0G0KFP8_9BACT|nr:MAG: Transposase [Parcubacteria group bacterium GW2011_GWB1_37_13]KKQ33889.1 MAG: Transposase [Candidatus Nomurabacteria bacterium GW2011_GWA1_37_20]KKQ48024.1 MAG: Transposase [Candidatus Yanofskybacteria bacterium GW2011_GWC2_37_9]